MNSLTDWETQIKRFQLLSTEMLDLAHAGEWAAVTEWEEKRRVLLDELYKTSPPAEVGPLLKDAAQFTLVSDARIQELAHAEMDKLSDRLRTIRQGRRALNAYQSS